MKKSTIIKLFKQPGTIIVRLGNRQLLNWIPDAVYLKLAYRGFMGVKLNLSNPQKYTEKIQWAKLYDRKREYTTYVDKYAVREHIAKTIGEEYLIPLIGVYNNPDEIDWDSLPEQFVLKCTHSSHTNVICKDKNTLDIPETKKLFNQWLKHNLFWLGREWAYKNVPPRIVCEQFISDTDSTPDDYKVLFFNSKPQIVEVHIGRFDNHLVDIYDLDWNRINLVRQYKESENPYPRPDFLEEMIHLSTILAQNTYISRIDWYHVNGKLYFGEITFYEASGFMKAESPDLDLLMGSWIDPPTNN